MIAYLLARVYIDLNYMIAYLLTRAYIVFLYQTSRGGYRRGARGAQAPLSSPNYT